MFDSVINYLDKFGPELLVIQFGFLVILSTLFLWLWFSNRRKYHNLKHAIPANVVKNYLDSIIQNSTSLKSSLFRGGGLDVDSVPSVMPLQNLTGGDGLAVSGAPSTALLEELNQKKAQIAALEAQLSSVQNAQKEFESKIQQTEKSSEVYEAKIKDLEEQLAKAKAAAANVGTSQASGGDEAIRAELDAVTKERDEYRDRLKEFEIISDDLANLKRLQQENEQLKRSLQAQGIPLPEAEVKEKKEVNVDNLLDDMGQIEKSAKVEKVFEEFMEEKAQAEEAEAAPTSDGSFAESLSAEEEASPGKEGEDKPKSEKTPEDLLSEFEKMLG